MDAAPPTLAEVLSESGYATGGFVGNLAYCLREQGIARGFQRYQDFYVDATVASFSTALGSFFALGGRFRGVDCVPCAGLRNNAPRVGRILIARGRDAADVPISNTFGPNTLEGFKVWAEEVADPSVAKRSL